MPILNTTVDITTVFSLP